MTKFDRSTLEASLAEIGAVVDHSTIHAWMQKLTARYGLSSAAYLGTGFGRKRNANESYLAVTYAPDWVERYKRRRYVEIDPVIQLGLRRVLPLDWDEFGNKGGRVRTLFGEANEFGLGKHGLSIPIHGHSGDRGLFSITSNLSVREWAREKLHYMRDFQVLAAHVHDKVLRLEGHQPKPANLSPRELECLQWIAEGKTAWECATILGLSQHTVRCYLESARYKLKAASNTHAVSIAHRGGLLLPPL